MAIYEVVNGTLVVQGNLDKANDPDFSGALERYCAKVAEGERVLDLSTVRWLNNTVAKQIISAATDVLEKGSKLRVVASRHVQQTLTLLSAQSYLTIETAAVKAAPESAEAPKPAELVGLDDADLVLPSAPVPAASPAPATAAPAVAAAPVSSSGLMAISDPSAPRQPRSGLLASPHEELSRGAVLFRVLQVDKRYCFIMKGQETVGIVRERIGGPWLMIDVSGRRKMINLDNVEMVEVL
jgi:anti-anti-sigma regulatory factor